MQKKHTTPGIRWSSPTQLLIQRFAAYLWESGRDPEFSASYGQIDNYKDVVGGSYNEGKSRLRRVVVIKLNHELNVFEYISCL
ncbi:unnamed protein product [Fusarium graminearum]|uniref:Uncharacterized protein n=1 Tax=Gibberella zeae TaxID=5518 RepID=A0A4E9ELL9_GIBZA|nr:unnamed protein product [Fusarium graminearum]CAG1985247.1 unnamed protein product [Fusarium graminearum]